MSISVFSYDISATMTGYALVGLADYMQERPLAAFYLIKYLCKAKDEGNKFVIVPFFESDYKRPPKEEIYCFDALSMNEKDLATKILSVILEHSRKAQVAFAKEYFEREADTDAGILETDVM